MFTLLLCVTLICLILNFYSHGTHTAPTAGDWQANRGSTGCNGLYNGHFTHTLCPGQTHGGFPS